MSDPAVVASGLADLVAKTANLSASGAYAGPVSGAVSATTLIASGTVFFTGLPTADPNLAGELWSNSGVLTVSAGA